MHTQLKSPKNLVLMSLFTALICLGAFIKIPIPYIPFTLQFLFTSLAGLLLGPVLGTLSVLLYLFIGLIGIPVFTQGGGFSYVFIPTFGYLLGFVFATFLTGLISSKKTKNQIKTYWIATVLGLFTVYTFGLLYYYVLSIWVLNTPVDLGVLFLYGFVLAIPGDLMLCFVASSLAKKIKPFVTTS